MIERPVTSKRHKEELRQFPRRKMVGAEQASEDGAENGKRKKTCGAQVVFCMV